MKLLNQAGAVQYVERRSKMQEIVVFDIDGTLSIISEERRELIRKRSWDKFHRLSICAPVNKEVVNALDKHFNEGKIIALITGRPERWGDCTTHWLEKNNISYHILYMRKNGDKRKSYYSKKEHVDKILKSYKIIEAWDDCQQDIDMFESYGIKTVKVEG